ncbi:DUF1853 family protein [Vibrio gazogenes]|uniref:Type II citrate synthase n=1 Tax=Vibrio gazogenes DSM 21264 = NBRC 103151 TaxID=1123492 RepID=A0A1M4XPV4_VIBGA|nr:DUF1853 family protein [Vibrio gazogenes]USP15307.1 DUF1853 family protein [Vibrio gazogenes]SHE95451.1 hypothetical protein SAMN02745781_01125 [Vibrio gazogenes DSM 21264] [Vibrio gazogenes DSM 21264 = NBRC 103151]
MDLTAIAQWVRETPGLFQAVPPIEPYSPFAEHTASPVSWSAHPHQRLGLLYQSVCSDLFKASPTYTLTAEEVQIIANGKTLGAVDFILNNQHTSQQEHWEVAIKFYLLHQELWFGPNAKDRLDIKLQHMLKHQLPLSAHPMVLQQYPQWQVTSQHLLMQGRLYINPFTDAPIPQDCLGYALNQTQIQGRWCYQAQFHQINEPLYLLERYQWMTGRTATNQCYEPDALERAVHCQSESGIFWFIVPDSWPQ